MHYLPWLEMLCDLIVVDKVCRRKLIFRTSHCRESWSILWINYSIARRIESTSSELTNVFHMYKVTIVLNGHS